MSTMKKAFLYMFLITVFVCMLLFPGPVFDGAADGLLLWFNIVLPTLFPFLLICNLLIRTGAVRFILRFTSPLLCRFFGVSEHGSFAVLAGFLCGYPMGAKVTADLIRCGSISVPEGEYLLSFCNNTSPMFIVSFLVTQNLKDRSLLLPVISILLLAPVLSGFLFRRSYTGSRKSAACAGLHETSRRLCGRSSDRLAVSALDSSVSDALEAITKVGAYIIAFSVLIRLLGLVPLPFPRARLLLLSSLEITGGIDMLCHSSLPRDLMLVSCLALTSFGGLCAAFQTQSMIRGTGLSTRKYLAKKLATALVTSLLTLLYVNLSAL